MQRPVVQFHRFSVLLLIGILASCTDSSGPPNVEPCLEFTTHTLGTSVAGSLASSDCRSPLKSDGYTDMHRVTLAQAGTYLFNQASPTLDTYLLLLSSDGSLIGANDDILTSTDSRIKAVLPAGEYVIGATSYNANATGSYTFSSASTTAGVTCEIVFIVPGVTTNQNLELGDCDGPFLRPNGAPSNGTRIDTYTIGLAAGAVINLTMTSTAVDSYLEIYAGNPLVRVAFNDNASGQNAQITYTAPVTGPYHISATSPTVGATGAYTLQVQ